MKHRVLLLYMRGLKVAERLKTIAIQRAGMTNPPWGGINWFPATGALNKVLSSIWIFRNGANQETDADKKKY